MEAAAAALFDLCNFDAKTREVVLLSFSVLGVEELGDIKYVKDKDMMKAGVKVVPARKFLAHYESYAPNEPKLEQKKTIARSSSGVSLTVSPPTVRCGPNSRPRSRSRTRSNPWMKDTKDSAFAKQFHCLSQYVTHLRGSLEKSNSRNLLRSTTKVSFPDEDEIEEFNRNIERTDSKPKLAKTLPNDFGIRLERDEPKIVPSCSLVEYEACITNQDSPLEVIKYLKQTSSELTRKIGGAVCPADTRVLPDGPREWIVNVKWALPMDNFALPGAPDPDELAVWIVEALPPKDPTAMSSCKGIFVDLDMSFFSDLTKKALKANS